MKTNKRTLRRPVIIFLTLISTGILFAQSQESIVYITSNSGLPNEDVYAIAIDIAGNKWIGASSGLAKFDGVSWTVYKTSNSGLPHNYVVEIAIDGAGNKWVGTYGGGIA